MEKQIVLTKESYDAKVKELEQLKTTGRDEIAERIKVARSFGDLSENSEYDEAMNEQAKLEAKIARLENDIRNANILDEDNLNAGVVHPGSKVKVEKCRERQEERVHYPRPQRVESRSGHNLRPVAHRQVAHRQPQGRYR